MDLSWAHFYHLCLSWYHAITCSLDNQTEIVTSSKFDGSRYVIFIQSFDHIFTLTSRPCTSLSYGKKQKFVLEDWKNRGYGNNGNNFDQLLGGLNI